MEGGRSRRRERKDLKIEIENFENFVKSDACFNLRFKKKKGKMEENLRDESNRDVFRSNRQREGG